MVHPRRHAAQLGRVAGDPARAQQDPPRIDRNLAPPEGPVLALLFDVGGAIAIAGLWGVVLISVFRRTRALAAVLPPLAVGTAWTMGIAALLPNGLSAISVAFAAVVVGVGVDTGVHVYAALLEGRRNGLGPMEAAEFARKKTARPTMLAAIAAGATGDMIEKVAAQMVAEKVVRIDRAEEIVKGIK